MLPRESRLGSIWETSGGFFAIGKVREPLRCPLSGRAPNLAGLRPLRAMIGERDDQFRAIIGLVAKNKPSVDFLWILAAGIRPGLILAREGCQLRISGSYHADAHPV